MKNCPKDKTELHGPKPCPQDGGALVAVTAQAPQAFEFCSICPQCWTGIAVEAETTYRLHILGDPIDWADGDWKAATAADALKGWATLSDIPDTPWWKRAALGPFILWAARSRPEPDSDWFQVFFAVRSAAGEDSKTERLSSVEQTFTAPLSGELYFFVNDHPDYYEKNNTGRMSLEISLVGP